MNNDNNNIMVRITIQESKILNQGSKQNSSIGLQTQQRYTFQRPTYSSRNRISRHSREITQIICPIHDGSLRSAAESCAAVLIQSTWRGSSYRQNQVKKLTIEKHKALKVQEVPIGKDHTYLQPTKIDNNSRRKANAPKVEIFNLDRERKEKIKEGYQHGYAHVVKEPILLKQSHLIALFYLQEEPSALMRKRYVEFLLQDSNFRAKSGRRSKNEPVYQFWLDSSVDDIRILYLAVFKWERKHQPFSRSRGGINEKIAKNIQLSVLSMLKPPKEILSFVFINKNIHGRSIYIISRYICNFPNGLISF